MGNLQYNLNPFTLLKNLYNNNVYGYSENEIEKAEKRLDIKLPKLLKEYYLTLGKFDINYCFHSLFTPDELDFSHNYLMEEIEEDDEEITLEDIKNTENYLLFRVENQGCFYQGIDINDVQEDNPKVYITTDDDLFQWEVSGNSFYSDILSMIGEQLDDSDFLFESFSKDKIQSIIGENKIDIEKLLPEENPYDSVHIVTCWDSENKKLFYFYREGKELQNLRVISAQTK